MLWTLVPAKPFHHSKRRLSSLLNERDRARLSAAMLAHTVRVAKQAFGHQPVMVVTPLDCEVSDVALAAGADRIFVSGGHGLNAQLSEAAAIVSRQDDVLVLHADLPLLRPDDLLALVAAEAPAVIAPDFIGLGTNALLQRTPTREFSFGPRSYERHLAQSTALGILPVIIGREGLARDLDEPPDFERLGLSLDHLIDRLLAQPERHRSND